MKKEPTCYNDFPPSPGIRAERGCAECKFELTCGVTRAVKKPNGDKPNGDKPNGDKHDSGKPRASLLPLGILYQVIAVLEFGAKRYAVDNWQLVPDARRRYYDAALRHIEAWWTGEQNDPESGLHHLAHATACLLFLIWFDGRTKIERPPCFGGNLVPPVIPVMMCEKCPHQIECVKEYTRA